MGAQGSCTLTAVSIMARSSEGGCPKVVQAPSPDPKLPQGACPYARVSIGLAVICPPDLRAIPSGPNVNELPAYSRVMPVAPIAILQELYSRRIPEVVAKSSFAGPARNVT